jgi:preprotein translocase subunit SecY
MARASATSWEWARRIADAFQRQGWVYCVSEIALIYIFSYVWTGVIFDPKEIAENLKRGGNFIPGYRPGARTADYIDRVLLRITYVGSAFLAAIAISPTLVSSFLEVRPDVAQFFGGTSLLIVVSVALDVVQRINSHLVMRNYPGLTDD